MSNIPADLLYTKEHEWLKPAADGTAVVGVTDYAQESLGDIVFVELPRVGKQLAAGAAFGVVESVKAASDLYMPVAGEVVEINPKLETEPGLVNREPYGAGWMIKIRVADAKAATAMLKADAYGKLV